MCTTVLHEHVIIGIDLNMPMHVRARVSLPVDQQATVVDDCCYGVVHGAPRARGLHADVVPLRVQQPSVVRCPFCLQLNAYNSSVRHG